MAKLLKESSIAEQVDRDVGWARDFRQDYVENWKRFYKLYKNYIDKGAYPFDANLAIPTAHSTVEVQVSFLIDMIFGESKFVDVLGKTTQGQISAHAISQMLDYHFRNSFRTFEDMTLFIRQLLIYGTSIYKVFWEFKPGWRTTVLRKYVDGELKDFTDALSPEMLVSKPTGYPVDIFSFGVDPNASCIGNARYAFEEMWMDPVGLKEKAQLGIFKNVDDVIGNTSNVNEGLKDRLEEINIAPNQNAPVKERGKVHIIDYWGYLTKGWKSDGSLSREAKQQLYHVVAGFKNSATGALGAPVILHAEPSPFRHNRIPFVDARLNPCVGEFYGTGDIDYCESLFHEQRDIRNIQLDNLNRTMNRMFVIGRGADIDKSELVWRPAGTITANNPREDIVVLDPGTFDPAVFKSQEDIRRDIEQETGINDFIMGQYRSSTGFNDTATGISLIQQVAMKRIAHKGQTVQRVIRDIGQMTFSLVAQYQPWGVTVRILDRDSATRYRFIDVSPAALAENYDFHIVNAPSLGSKPLRQNQLIQLLQLLIQLRNVGGPSVDIPMFVRRILEEMEIPNAQEFTGFQDFNAPLENLGVPASTEEFLPPDEENRLMVEQGQMVYPKLAENHTQHMLVHGEIYDSVENEETKRMIAEHYNLHVMLAKQAKQLIATTMETQSMQAAVSQQEQQLNLLTGGTNRSPTKAGGQEDVVRAMGNLTAGNV